MIADQVRLFINLFIIKLHEPLNFFLKRLDFFFILICHFSLVILRSSLNFALFYEHFLLHFIDLLLFFDSHLFNNLSVFLSEHSLFTHYLLIAVFKLPDKLIPSVEILLVRILEGGQVFLSDSQESRLSFNFEARCLFRVSSLPCLRRRATWTRVWYWFYSTRLKVASLEMPSVREQRKRLPWERVSAQQESRCWVKKEGNIWKSKRKCYSYFKRWKSVSEQSRV
jgi:hypothetical protein